MTTAICSRDNGPLAAIKAEPDRPILLAAGIVLTRDATIGDWADANVLLGGALVVGVGPGLDTAANDDGLIVVDCHGCIVMPSGPSGVARIAPVPTPKTLNDFEEDSIMSKTWFITGATRGLGKEIALAALGAGDTVIATGRKAEDVESALAEADAGDRLLAVALDVTDDSRPNEVVEAAVARFGRIDVLVNNAGYGQLGFFETLTPGQIETQYRTNVFGLYAVTRAVLPQMRAQRSGHVLNISSIGGVVGFGGAPAYTSSKFAIEGFSEDMAIDLKPFGIHVTIVEPGFFRTDFLEGKSVKYGEVPVDDYAEANEKQRAQYDAHSGKQLGDPKKLGQALLRIVAEDAPPLRYAAGSDAVKMTRDVLEKRLAELDRWQELSRSTDSEDSATA